MANIAASDKAERDLQVVFIAGGKRASDFRRTQGREAASQPFFWERGCVRSTSRSTGSALRAIDFYGNAAAGRNDTATLRAKMRMAVDLQLVLEPAASTADNDCHAEGIRMKNQSLPDFISLEVHSGCFPEIMTERMMRELRAGRMPQILHYQGAAQSARWKRLYEAWSPYKRSEEYRGMYSRCFGEVAGQFKDHAAIVGIGCGTGDKELQLVTELEKQGTKVDLALVDASQTLLLTAVLQFSQRPGVHGMFPLIADLEGLESLNSWLDARLGKSVPRLFTCFSVLPNFRPNTLLGRIAKWMRGEDRLLVSVNLAPANDPKWPDRILPQYDNAETRQWLLTTLDQGGVSLSSGKLEFTTGACQEDARTLKIAAQWQLQSDAKFCVNDAPVDFHEGTSMELFFSCRYREGVVQDQLREQGLSVCDAWRATNGEEVIYLCRSVVPAR